MSTYLFSSLDLPLFRDVGCASDSRKQPLQGAMREQITALRARVDAIAERVQTLGGVTFALAQDIVDESSMAKAPRGRESALAQLERLLAAHETILIEARPLARLAADAGDDGTNDLIVSQVVRLNELQSWFAGEHVAAQTAAG